MRFVNTIETSECGPAVDGAGSFETGASRVGAAQMEDFRSCRV